jgi:hypothetical protein
LPFQFYWQHENYVILENPDEPTKIYELANGKVVKATDKYFWVDIAQEISSQGLVTFRKFPSGPSNKDDIYIKAMNM